MLVSNVGHVVAGQGHGVEPLPRSGGVVEPQGEQAILRPGRQIAAPQVDFPLPRLAQRGKMPLQHPTQLRVQVKAAVAGIIVYEEPAVHQQLLRLFKPQIGKPRRLRQGEARKDGNFQQEVLLLRRQPTPEHRFQQLIHAAWMKGTGCDETRHLQPQRHDPALGQTPRFLHLFPGKGNAGSAEIGIDVLVLEDKAILPKPPDVPAAGSVSPLFPCERLCGDNDVEPLSAMMRERVEKRSWKVDFPVHEIVEPQVGVLSALQRLKRPGDFGQRIFVRRTDEFEPPGAVRVHLRDYGTELPPAIPGAALHELIPSPQDAMGQPGVQKMLQNGGLPEAGWGLHQRQGIALDVLQPLHQVRRIVFDPGVDWLRPGHGYLLMGETRTACPAFRPLPENGKGVPFRR